MKIHSYHFFSECVLYIQHKRQHTYLISVYNWYLCSNMILSHVLTEQPIIYYVIEYNLQCHVNWHCCYWTYNFIFMSERRRRGDRFNEAEIKFFNSIMIFFLLIWKKLKKVFLVRDKNASTRMKSMPITKHNNHLLFYCSECHIW